MLLDRSTERAAFDRLLADVRAGESQALVLRGEAGIGKTALLSHLVSNATGCHIVPTAGVEAEQELAFAALHQLCAPMLDRLECLPGPQRDALMTAFGLSAGRPPDRFMVGMGVLGLLSDHARDQPVLCVIDDAQWLDLASAQVLGFTARRLRAESVAMVFAVRGSADDEMPDLAALPDLLISGLPDGDARTLLASTHLGQIDDRVLDRLIAESRGNPLALAEIPRGFTPAELAGGFAPGNSVTLPRRIEESYRRQIAGVTPAARQILLIAAAEPTGNPVLVWRAANRLGIGPEVDIAASLTAAGLLEFDSGVRFRHPLLRSAVYRAATAPDRRRVHEVLAEVTDPVTDPDRRAWHRAQAADDVSEDVAADLEHRAGRAQARGGLAAAAAVFERAAELTPDAGRRGERLLAAAQAKHEAGMPQAGLALLAMAHAVPLSELARARADLLGAHIAFALHRGRDMPALLLRAAARLQPLDPALARTVYLDALRVAWYAADPGSSATLRDVARAATTALPAATPLQPADLLLKGLAVRYTAGFRAGVPMLKTALKAFLDPGTAHWPWLANTTAVDLCDDVAADLISSKSLRSARDAGALALLPAVLTQRIIVQILAGDLTEAGALLDELHDVSEETGVHWPTAYSAQVLAAWSGHESRTASLIAESTADAERRGEGLGPLIGGWSWAILCNGTGRFDEALPAAQKATASSQEMGILTWAPLVELIIAAGRIGGDLGSAAVGADALQRLNEMTQACGTDWALGMEACCRAVLSGDETAYRESIERLTRTRIRPYLARAHLYYGEWLWRCDRRVEAREQLQTAHGLFSAMGMEAFAATAATKLGTAGRTRLDKTSTELTAQETQIVRLTRDGLSNAEVGARLFISPRTVEWHLSKIYNKLGITSRRQLGHPATPT
jgi:DNA-binding CsgD family transcriptional regulator